MGLAAQVIIGGLEKSAEAEAFTALVAGTGDSFQIANFDFSSPAYLDEVWGAASAGAETIRIRSPRMHDDAQGLRLVNSLANTRLLPEGIDQLLYPGDTLIVEGADSEKEKALLAAMLVYYSDLPGISARLATRDEILPRIKNVAGVQINEVTTKARDWGAGKAINASFDTLKSGTDYAVLGYMSSIAGTAIRIVGPDTGNLGIGGPLALDPARTSSWFVDQSRLTGRPYIPIIASNNKAATLVSAAALTEVKPNVTLVLAELG
jgi:hypothetical protein